jgi:hypothetical protein
MPIVVPIRPKVITVRTPITIEIRAPQISRER